jgi:hypothetical protein
VAGSALGVTTGQFASAGVLALPPIVLGAPVGFAAFAILMIGSGLTRLVLATRVEVSATWSTATAAYSVAELKGATPLPPNAPPDEPGGGWPIRIRATGRAAAPTPEPAATESEPAAAALPLAAEPEATPADSEPAATEPEPATD